MNCCRSPKNSAEFTKYYQLRWQVLREPWQQPIGSEKDELEEQSYHRMIINSKDEVLAVARLERIGQHQGKIRYMAVSENTSGQGLGRQLVVELEALAQQLGITEIILEAREKAVGFYERLGYQQVGKSHLLFNEIQHFTMQKSLFAHVAHQTELVNELQNTWHDTIPMSKAMNIEISYYDKAKLITHCDPAFNKNLHHTMFAGSIYTLATLTGWGWVYLQLKQAELDGDIVLANADIKYRAPIKGTAHCQLDFEEVVGELTPLKEGKKAKMSVMASLYSGDKLAATFHGQFAVLPKKS